MAIIYTAQEIAEILRVNYRTVLTLIKKGDLKAIKINGGAYRVTDQALNKYLKLK